MSGLQTRKETSRVSPALLEPSLATHTDAIVCLPDIASSTRKVIDSFIALEASRSFNSLRGFHL